VSADTTAASELAGRLPVGLITYEAHDGVVGGHRKERERRDSGGRDLD
jgi:hypothetical protein